MVCPVERIITITQGLETQSGQSILPKHKRGISDSEKVYLILPSNSPKPKAFISVKFNHHPQSPNEQHHKPSITHVLSQQPQIAFTKEEEKQKEQK